MIRIPSAKNLTDEVILEMARTVHYECLSDLGAKLGFTLVEVDNIKHEHMKNIRKTVEKLLMSWKTKNGDGPEQMANLRKIMSSLSTERAQQSSRQGNIIMTVSL